MRHRETDSPPGDYISLILWARFAFDHQSAVVFGIPTLSTNMMGRSESSDDTVGDDTK